MLNQQLLFATKRRYKNAVLNFDKLLANIKWAPLISLIQKGLELYNIEQVDFRTTPIFAKIKEYFGPQTIIMESVVRSCDIPDVNRSILSKLTVNK